jgi:hypothetical protein
MRWQFEEKSKFLQFGLFARKECVNGFKMMHFYKPRSALPVGGLKIE